MRNSFLALVLVSIVAASARAQGAAAPPTHIGTAAAVHGLVKAAAPGAIGRVVESGKPLFLNDHVTTDAAGRLQILLADETVFTIGPNADMVLDKFVYDPATGQGSVAAQIVRGAFRFVTGRIARRQPDSMKVRLNVGVIGIRGTVVVGETGSQGSTVINAGAGPSNDANEPPSAITVTNGGATVNISHTGEGTRFTNNGAPSNPAPMGDELDRISNVLGSKPSSKQASRGVLGGSDHGTLVRIEPAVCPEHVEQAGQGNERPYGRQDRRRDCTQPGRRDRDRDDEHQRQREQPATALGQQRQLNPATCDRNQDATDRRGQLLAHGKRDRDERRGREQRSARVEIASRRNQPALDEQRAGMTPARHTCEDRGAHQTYADRVHEQDRERPPRRPRRHGEQREHDQIQERPVAPRQRVAFVAGPSD